jgi:hypothetical protein
MLGLLLDGLSTWQLLVMLLQVQEGVEKAQDSSG